ncbi:MAG: biotin--[acetyl-CoA-carboxylase] ligase [Alphaproteobacteria bacterium]|nr:biotin--[acetyl-CoA-carboxylase] ligase [Alphaproteobacteria bacterium]
MFKIKSFSVLPSTQDEVQNSPFYTLVVAETLTQARGQRGNKWEAPRGNLYFSFSMKSSDFQQSSDLCFLCGLAMAHAIDSSKVKLKWPNDIFIEDAKCCGILVEQNGDKLIGGLGVNVSVSPDYPNPDYPLTSLKEKGILIEVKDLLEKFIQNFEIYFEQYQKNPSFIFSKWKEKALWMNEKIYLKSDLSIQGTFIDVDEKGGVILQTSEGNKVFYSGSFRRL